MRIFEAIAAACDAARNCERAGNAEWESRWHERLDAIERDYLPRGSGFDCGSKIDRDASGCGKIVIATEFHHMNDCGMYDGWTQHNVTARPDFVFGCALTIGGRNRNAIKDYMADVFNDALERAIEWADLDSAPTQPERESA